MIEYSRFSGAAIVVIVIALASLATTSPAQAQENQTPVWAPLESDAFLAPDLPPSGEASNLQHNSPEPGFYETSEYFIGSIAVRVIVPESDGTLDASTEDWTSAETTSVLNAILDGINWWAGLDARANISGWVIGPTLVTTQYEPITRPYTDQGLWISEIMDKLGYSSGSYFTQVRSYVNDLRSSYGTDWAWVIFVVDSSSDLDGRFADGRFAYAYLGGPFMVMTYDNNNWGIGRMDRVTAHEMGHIFYATDEYDGEPRFSGYLDSLEIEGSGCIMDNSNWCASEGTLHQIGWVDRDADSVFDIVGTAPEVSLTPYSPDPTNASTLSYSGTAAVVPFPNRNPVGTGNDVTIATIRDVYFDLDGTGWLAASPTDGAFDQTTEAFTFSFPAGNGWHEVWATAYSNYDQNDVSYAYDDITVDRTPPDSAVSALPIYRNTSSFAVEGTVSDSLSVSTVELWYSKDGGDYQSYAFLSSPPWEWRFDTGLTGGEGQYRFYTVATDSAGNREVTPGTPDTDTIVDLTMPVSVATVQSASSNSSLLSVTAAAADNVGIDSVELWYRSTEGRWRLFDTRTSPPWEWSFNTTHFGGDVTYDFYTRSRDLAGNYEGPPPSADATVTVDAAAPVSILRPLPESVSTETLDLSVQIYDSSDIASVTLFYSFEGGPWVAYKTLGEEPWMFTFDFPEGSGRYEFLVQSVDAYGNVEAFDENRRAYVSRTGLEMDYTLFIAIGAALASAAAGVLAWEMWRRGKKPRPPKAEP